MEESPDGPKWTPRHLQAGSGPFGSSARSTSRLQQCESGFVPPKSYLCLVGNGWEGGNRTIFSGYYGSFPHSRSSLKQLEYARVIFVCHIFFQKNIQLNISFSLWGLQHHKLRFQISKETRRRAPV